MTLSFFTRPLVRFGRPLIRFVDLVSEFGMIVTLGGPFEFFMVTGPGWDRGTQVQTSSPTILDLIIFKGPVKVTV